MKKNLITIATLLISSAAALAQVVQFKDNKFKAALLADQTINTNGDNEIQITEATAVKVMHVYGKGIKDMTGLEAFVNLEQIRCDNNQFSSVDLSHNPALTDFRCGENPNLRSLDVTRNKLLKSLDISLTSIENIDLAQNELLEELQCTASPLTTLDLSANHNLEYLAYANSTLQSLDLRHNKKLKNLYLRQFNLETLDLSQNRELVYLHTYSSPSLKTICVADLAAVQDPNDFFKDAATEWSTSCGVLTGLNKTTIKNGGGIYPNPAEEMLFLEHGGAVMYIFNASGEQIMHLTGDKADISTLKPGLYHIRINRPDNQTNTTSFIKK